MQPDRGTPDERKRNAILAMFAADRRTAAAGLRVGVLNGIVHLAGVVDSKAVRSAAEEIARKMPGVLGVVNRIEAPGAPKPARTIHLDLRNKKS